MTNPSATGPYGSARDLPSVQEMERQLTAFKLIGAFLSKDQRKQVKESERELRRITNVVDAFYSLLGPRNWVFTGDLNLTAIDHIVDTNNADTAEARLISYYRQAGRITFPLRRLHRFEAMRPRMDLLTKAVADYEAGRYYSTILVLLSMMDGFVNDLDQGDRKGLHTRPAEGMVAWDSVAGHHMGLSHAHQSFVKSFYKTNTAEAAELHRNGIMHGTLVNFDNEVVATKAWNRLFAVTDWAEARERHAEPAEPKLTLRESVARWQQVQDQKSRIEEWQAYEYEPDLAVQNQPEMVQTCTDFLDRWHRKQWGLVGSHFMEFGSTRSSVGTLAILAKDLYQASELSSWAINCVRHTAAAVAFADVNLTINGKTYRTELRWVRVDDAGSIATEWEPGRWTLSLFGPSHFIKPEYVIRPEPAEPDDRPDG